jgi:hypothetical protein
MVQSSVDALAVRVSRCPKWLERILMGVRSLIAAPG